MKYYLFETNIASNVYSGKFLRFEEASSKPSGTNFDSTTTPPPLFLPPYCPYWNGTSWELKKGPQKYYKVSGTSISVLENSVYEFTVPITSLTFTNNPIFLKETSVFFTFTNNGTHTVSFPSGAKVVGSQQYWRNGESYIITIYNGYYIIGVSKNPQ